MVFVIYFNCLIVFIKGDPANQLQGRLFYNLLIKQLFLLLKGSSLYLGYITMLKLAFIFIFCLPLFLLSAQNLQGVWEGKLELNDKGSKYMNVRLELMQEDSSLFGLLYTRGLEKNTIFGCDYFVTGFKSNNSFYFKWQKVQRSVAMNETDCQTFQRLLLNFKQKGSVNKLEGGWAWQSGQENFVSCTKVSDTISDMATDEISVYVNDLFEVFEKSGIMLPVSERLPKKVFDMEVDSSDVIVEFSSVDSSKHDSIAVYFNGTKVVELQSLLQKPLRVKLQSMPYGVNDLLVVSQSVKQLKLNIRVKVLYRGELNFITIQPGISINSLLLFTRKQE